MEIYDKIAWFFMFLTILTTYLILINDFRSFFIWITVDILFFVVFAFALIKHLNKHEIKDSLQEGSISEGIVI